MKERSDLSVLFLCTHNSARSIIAEAILRKMRPDALSFSAGSAPKRAPHPLTLELLRSFGHDLSELSSKSWDAFSGLGAPKFDYVITLCDQAAGEICPRFPGQWMKAHWPVSDPSAEAGGAVARRVAFVRAYRQIEQRMDAFLSSNLVSPQDADAATRAQIQDRIDLVGEMMYHPREDDDKWAERLRCA